jgi:hypothetical protein
MFVIIAIQILLAESKHVCLCSFASCFETNLSQTMKPKSVVDDFIDKMQTICHFSNRHLLCVDRVTCKLKVVLVCGCWQASGWFLMCNICPSIFLIFQSIPRHSVAAKHCSRTVPNALDEMRPLIHIPDNKSCITECCFSLRQTERGTTVINSKTMNKEGTGLTLKPALK